MGSRVPAVAAAQRGLPVEEVEAFGRSDAALRAGTPLPAGAAVASRAALERDLRRFAAPVTEHAAAHIAPPVPAPPPGPLPPRCGAPVGLVCHVTLSPPLWDCISGAKSRTRRPPHT